MHLNRRSFLKSVLAGIAVASIGPTLPKVAVAMDPCPHNKDGVCTCGMTFHPNMSAYERRTGVDPETLPNHKTRHNTASHDEIVAQMADYDDITHTFKKRRISLPTAS